MALKQAYSATDGITDLLYVATGLNLCCNPIPDAFVPVLPEGLVEPPAPLSLDEAFGAGSGYVYSDIYTGYYDSATNSWKMPMDGSINMEIQADIQLQLDAIALYNSLAGPYNMDYGVQRDVQWRKKVAQALIDVCAG